MKSIKSPAVSIASATSIPRAGAGLQRPDLYDVWLALRSGHPCLTISVRHRLVEKFDFPASLVTSVVLRRLKRLEKIGKVARVHSASLSGICWTVTENYVRVSDERAKREDAKRLSPQGASAAPEGRRP